MKPQAAQNIIKSEVNEGPTPERKTKAGSDIERVVTEVEEITPGKNRAMVQAHPYRLADSPLGKLARAKVSNITATQYIAGEQIYADAFHSGLLSSGVVDPAIERVDGGCHKDVSYAVMAAQTRYHRAVMALSPPEWAAVSAVVIQEQPLANFAERFHKFNERRSRQAIALQMLRNGLDALDLHYNPKPPPKAGGLVQSWGADDYRPGIPQEA